MADLYTYFFERGIELLKKGGLFGIIVANKWMRANYGEPLRKWFKTQTILRIVDFGDLPVFHGVTTYPCIVIVSHPSMINDFIKVTAVEALDFKSISNYVTENEKTVSKENLKDSGWQLISDYEIELLEKLHTNAVPLGEFASGKIFRGVLTGLNEAFVIDKATKVRLITKDPQSAEIIKPFLAGRDIKRYQPPQSDKFLILFPKGFTNEHYTGKQPWNWLKEMYSAIALHLEPYADKAQNRWDQGDYWWELRACDYYDEFENIKIMLPDIAIRPQAMYDDQGLYCVNTAYIIPSDNKLLLAILNSKLVHFYYSKISSTIRGGYMRFIRQYLETIPITKSQNTQFIQLVDDILKLNEQLQSTKLETQRQQIQRTIDHAEKKIDELVYELYGLTEDEIKIVEESQNGDVVPNLVEI